MYKIMNKFATERVVLLM